MTFETPDRQQENVNVSLGNLNGTPSEQLPRHTSRQTLYRFYSFLLGCFGSALITQVVSYVPSARPHINRVPFAVAGCVIFTAGVLQFSKKEIPASALTGIVLGSIVGL